MRHWLRTLLLLLILAGLPLRGQAGVLMSLCESRHGGAETAVDHHAHHHEDGEAHDHPDDKDAPLASVCSACASCCAGAGMAPDAALHFSFQLPGTGRIPFIGRLISGYVPEHLDRPPLPL
jgi:hypothetical protein